VEEDVEGEFVRLADVEVMSRGPLEKVEEEDDDEGEMAKVVLCADDVEEEDAEETEEANAAPTLRVRDVTALAAPP